MSFPSYSSSCGSRGAGGIVWGHHPHRRGNSIAWNKAALLVWIRPYFPRRVQGGAVYAKACNRISSTSSARVGSGAGAGAIPDQQLIAALALVLFLAHGPREQCMVSLAKVSKLNGKRHAPLCGIHVYLLPIVDQLYRPSHPIALLGKAGTHAAPDGKKLHAQQRFRGNTLPHCRRRKLKVASEIVVLRAVRRHTVIVLQIRCMAYGYAAAAAADRKQECSPPMERQALPFAQDPGSSFSHTPSTPAPEPP